jgi:hypothetical protein
VSTTTEGKPSTAEGKPPTAESRPAAPVSAGAGYAFGRPHGKCSICGRGIAPGEKFTAAVRESSAGLERVDLGGECWESFDKSPLLAHWRATMPEANSPAKPRVFVDDTVLCDLFERLAEAPAGEEPGKANFHFVLGLILMRKRLLSYESTHVENGREFWTVRMKGREQPIDLLNPRMDEQQVALVSDQLGQILSGDMA